jgi:maltose alpha-D-glucosyltransferase / alpha-amylase
VISLPEPLPREFVTLVVPPNSSWLSLARTRNLFERDVLPGFLANRRWFPERDQSKIRPTLSAGIPLSSDDDSEQLWITLVEAKSNGVSARYLLPLEIHWVRSEQERQNPRAMAAVRQGPREGTVMDVASDSRFVIRFLRNLQRSLTIDESGRKLVFSPTAAFLTDQFREPERVRAVTAEQSNSTTLVDTEYVVKVYRKLEAGINPEIEMGRFLTEQTEFVNTPALLGTCELIESGERTSIGIIHRMVDNQGDGWEVSTAYIDRYLDEQRLLSPIEQPTTSEQLAPYLRLVAQTGRRLAELHLALSSRVDISDFRPDPVGPEDIDTWTDAIKGRAERVFNAFEAHRSEVHKRDLHLLDELISLKHRLEKRLENLLPRDLVALKIRHHGDFHLGQMLVTKDDVFIIDFEGEPKRTFAERRYKMPAARDVAGLIRSLDYSVMAAFERAKAAGSENRRIETAISLWREEATGAFLAAYRERVDGSPLWPADAVWSDKLLKFFLLEKALYEIEYEIAYRPDWVRVPLIGTLKILTEVTSA